MLLRLCHSSRDRRKLGKCVLEGPHTILAYLDRFGVPELVVLDAALLDRPEMRLIAERAGARQVVAADSRLFGELAQTASPTGVLAVIEAPKLRSTRPGSFNLLLEWPMFHLLQLSNVLQILLSQARY